MKNKKYHNKKDLINLIKKVIEENIDIYIFIKKDDLPILETKNETHLLNKENEKNIEYIYQTPMCYIRKIEKIKINGFFKEIERIKIEIDLTNPPRKTSTIYIKDPII